MRALNLGPLAPFDTRTRLEIRNLTDTIKRPFSGYLGGIHRGGYWVERLIAHWCDTFWVKYAIPCNSATSGILAAFMAAGVGPGDVVWAPVYTMSATAAPAMILGARVKFLDIEPHTFTIDMDSPLIERPKALIVTNLFGHPAHLTNIRVWCDQNKVVMIEDNAQGIMAVEGSAYAGTIGHIGVFSLNVHKHLSAGEGGVVVTNDSALALNLKDAINHGELRQGIIGLNLRMTEPTAAIACAQLSRIYNVTVGRNALGNEMTDMVKGINGVIPPSRRHDCNHAYYIWAARITQGSRHEFVETLVEHGLPMNLGYSPLLNRVFKINGHFPIAEKMEDEQLITFDICSYSPTQKQRKIMRELFDLAGSKIS